MFPFLGSSRKAFSSFRHFIRSILPLAQASEPVHLAPSTECILKAEIQNTRSTLVSGVGEPESSGIVEGHNNPHARVIVDDDQHPHSSVMEYGPSSTMEATSNVIHKHLHTLATDTQQITGIDLPDSISSTQPVPTSRLRVKSHPDIQALCLDWAGSNGAKSSTVYKFVNDSNY